MENQFEINWQSGDIDFFNTSLDGDLYEHDRLFGISAERDSCFSREDLRSACWLISKGDNSLAAKLQWQNDDCQRIPFRTSRFGLRGEAGVYLHVLEQFGVTPLLSHVCQDKYNQWNWLFKTMCPFHRRVHSHNHWYISESKRGGYWIGCFHLSLGKKFHPNYYLVADLPGFGGE